MKTCRHRYTQALCIAVVAAAGTLFAAPLLADKHVTSAGSFNADGSPARPYASVGTAACQLAPGETLRIQSGVYPDTLRIDTSSRIESTGGLVRIGDEGRTQTTLRIATYNTHLFGDAVPNLSAPFPPIPLNLEWMDEQRADRIGDAALGEDADLFSMQEVWDPALMNRIVSRAGYPYIAYGAGVEPELYDPPGPGGPFPVPGVLNSGLLMLSRHPLSGPSQVAYTSEAEFFEILASKGFLFARITKDGIPVAIVNTHLQAHYESDQVAARESQLYELAVAIESYQAANPSHAVIAMGDFNVFGESDEYVDAMVSSLGSHARLLDLVHNMRCVTPGPAHDTSLHDNPLNVHFTTCSEPAYSSSTAGCHPVGETCDYFCGTAQDLCRVGCEAAHGTCVGACTGACVTGSIIEDCLAAIPQCAIECCGFTGCDSECYEACFAGCGVFDQCVNGCENACTQELSGCQGGCDLDCQNCQACERACETQFCGAPTADQDARLDYVLYAGSRDGSVDIVPIDYALRDYVGPDALSGDGLSTSLLSDHRGVMAEFRLVKRTPAN